MDEDKPDLIDEYQEWLEDRLERIRQVYNNIFNNIIKVKDFDNLVKELGNPLFDLDLLAKGLSEYERDLEIYIHNKNVKKEKPKPTFKIIGD